MSEMNEANKKAHELVAFVRGFLASAPMTTLGKTQADLEWLRREQHDAPAAASTGNTDRRGAQNESADGRTV